jgi:hypothetical protein
MSIHDGAKGNTAARFAALPAIGLQNADAGQHLGSELGRIPC